MQDRQRIGIPVRDKFSGRIPRGAADAPWLAEYAFLIRESGDLEALLDAELQATRWGVSLQQALFAGEAISEERYAQALASALGVPRATDYVVLSSEIAAQHLRTRPGGVATSAEGLWRGLPALFVCATAEAPSVVARRVALAQAWSPDHAIVLVTQRTLSVAAEQARAPVLVKAATYGLKRHLPLFSAGRRAPLWQKILAGLVPLVLAGGIYAEPRATLTLLLLGLTLPFIGTTLVRLVALLGQFGGRFRTSKPSRRIPDHELPVYSILVALFEEAAVLPDLIAALSSLDYPPAKLDCLLVIEDADSETKLAFLKSDLPPWMRVVIVPDGALRTKPRALNYALWLARGDYVVVYDAEDRPEADQLRRALAAFQAGGPRLACVQSCLNIFNARQSWLTRQFTVEYSALFDAVLPALQRLRLPIPLGGTSNHFRRALLEEMHGWDPYNVTEDADLGIRIARLGHRTTVISSTTWEEAPASLVLWLRQRTRWLKGWMQTYLVHTRRPIGLIRDLGFFRALGFHFYMGGLILSALVHPLFYAALAADYAFDLQQEGFDIAYGGAFLLAGIVNLVVGYVTAIASGAIASRRRGHRLTLTALLMPLYWLLISVAAYRALWQLFRDPFRWEKTPHGLAQEDS